TLSAPNVTPPTSYRYRVRASDTANNVSAYSNTASVAMPTGPAPAAPANLTAITASSSQINLSWAAATEPGGTISSYLVERCRGASCTGFVQIGTSTTTALSDTGLNGSTTYCYRVRAQDAANNIGSYSGLASATTPAPTITAPTNLTTTAASSTQINLSWTAATETGGTISSYLVERDRKSTRLNSSHVATSYAASF